MRNHSLLLTLLMPLLLLFFAEYDLGPNVEILTSSTKYQDNNTLEGTWQLMAAKLAHTGEGESTNFSSESDVVALKIFTRNRFVAIRYDRTSKVLLGTGGGTYIQLGNEFTEYIDYHSWDSTLVNHPQNFTCTFEGNLFTQRGTIKGGNTDGESLEEIYQRVEAPSSTMGGNYPLLGSWKLETWANGDLEEPEALADGVHGFKLFTPTFFYAMRYRDSGGIDSFAFGSYSATPDYLTETVVSAGDLSVSGRSFVFSWSRTDQGFVQKGFLDSDEFMGFKIEEYYSRE